MYWALHLPGTGTDRDQALEWEAGGKREQDVMSQIARKFPCESNSQEMLSNILGDRIQCSADRLGKWLEDSNV